MKLDSMMPPPVFAYIEAPQRLLVISAAFILPAAWCVARTFWVGGATKGAVGLAAVIMPWIWVYIVFGRVIKHTIDNAINIL